MLPYYKRCKSYDSTDYHSWLVGIKAGGYATDPNYVSSNEAMIRKYGLDKYDIMAKNDAVQRGLTIGYMRGKTDDAVEQTLQMADKKRMLAFEYGHWAMPVAPDGNNQLVVTSGYGHRTVPTQGASSEHKGIDIKVDNVPVFATEDNGKVIATGYDKGGGNYVKVEYSRSDGTKYQVACLHLSQINVKLGDTVQAGQQIAVSGNTGVSTGAHLDFRVKKGTGDNMRYINPSEYLAEIAVRGGLTTEIKQGNKDLLAEFKSKISVQGDNPTMQNIDQSQLLLAKATNSNDVSDWMSYLMAQNKENGISMGNGDIISEFVGMILAGTMAVASQMGNGSESAVNSDKAVDQAKIDATISPETIIERKRDGVSPLQAKQLASINYDSLNPEQSQGQGYRLA